MQRETSLRETKKHLCEKQEARSTETDETSNAAEEKKSFTPTLTKKNGTSLVLLKTMIRTQKC